MVASNASTCWEGWDNETSRLYEERGGHYHGSHNHAWLCGGVGEVRRPESSSSCTAGLKQQPSCAVQWVYSRLAGIRPTSNGFATCKIAPHISKTLGPATMSTSLATPRGTVWSNWTRHDGDSATILSLGVRVPLLSQGELVLPCVPATPHCLGIPRD